MFNTALKSIIDFLKLKKDSKKIHLEIENLEREKENAESRINILSFDEITRYDPKVRELIKINMLPYRTPREKSFPFFWVSNPALINHLF